MARNEEIVPEEDLLTQDELAELWRLQDIIHEGLQWYIAVGDALMTIRDQRLYREDYSTFGEYCRQKWGMTDRHCRNLINAADVAHDLVDDPVANPEGLPRNERQARELRPVPRERRAEVWEQAVAIAGGPESVCYHDVKQARKVLIDDPAEEERRELEAMDRAEQPVDSMEVTVHNVDPRNHAMRIINKHGAHYAHDLSEAITEILAEKGI